MSGGHSSVRPAIFTMSGSRTPFSSFQFFPLRLPPGNHSHHLRQVFSGYGIHHFPVSPQHPRQSPSSITFGKRLPCSDSIPSRYLSNYRLGLAGSQHAQDVVKLPGLVLQAVPLLIFELREISSGDVLRFNLGHLHCINQDRIRRPRRDLEVKLPCLLLVFAAWELVYPTEVLLLNSPAAKSSGTVVGPSKRSQLLPASAAPPPPQRPSNCSWVIAIVNQGSATMKGEYGADDCASFYRHVLSQKSNPIRPCHSTLTRPAKELYPL